MALVTKYPFPLRSIEMINVSDDFFLFSLNVQESYQLCCKINLQSGKVKQYTLLTQYFLETIHLQKPRCLESYVSLCGNYWMIRRCAPSTSKSSYLAERRKADVIFLKLGGMLLKHCRETSVASPLYWENEMKQLVDLIPSDLSVKESDLFEALNTFPIRKP